MSSSCWLRHARPNSSMRRIRLASLELGCPALRQPRRIATTSCLLQPSSPSASLRRDSLATSLHVMSVTGKVSSPPVEADASSADSSSVSVTTTLEISLKRSADSGLQSDTASVERRPTASRCFVFISSLDLLSPVFGADDLAPLLPKARVSTASCKASKDGREAFSFSPPNDLRVLSKEEMKSHTLTTSTSYWRERGGRELW
mmetsp:Transcript_29798/g.86892  ORF Transcript_29798/g.86892 Transcript_29798/m.86892 type:complete len:203 (-) Transcript_29798:1664-2272(-)